MSLAGGFCLLNFSAYNDAISSSAVGFCITSLPSSVLCMGVSGDVMVCYYATFFVCSVFWLSMDSDADGSMVLFYKVYNRIYFFINDVKIWLGKAEPLFFFPRLSLLAPTTL